jgi:PAS domain S-box-containing protein
MPQLAWVSAPEGTAIHYNRRWYEYTGASPAAMESDGWRAFHDPELLPAALKRWEESVAAGRPFEMALRLRRHDGVFRWFMTHVAPVRHEDGRILRWIGTHTDIEERKGVERDLDGALKMREELLAIVSHDLRNPLSTVLLAAKTIDLFTKGSDAEERTKKATTAIVRAVDQMTRLVGDLLDLTKLERSQPLRMELDAEDVAALTARAVESCEPLARTRKLSLESQLPEGPVYVTCDGDRIAQVLGNLIGNAVKFTRDGGSIRVAVVAKGAEVVVSVADTGQGIRNEDLDRIFEPYWQPNGQKKPGAGLGLAIVRAIVEAHGGRVWVDTVPGSGSTFYFSLPAAEPALAKEET